MCICIGRLSKTFRSSDYSGTLASKIIWWVNEHIKPFSHRETEKGIFSTAEYYFRGDTKRGEYAYGLLCVDERPHYDFFQFSLWGLYTEAVFYWGLLFSCEMLKDFLEKLSIQCYLCDVEDMYSPEQILILFVYASYGEIK